MMTEETLLELKEKLASKIQVGQQLPNCRRVRDGGGGGEHTHVTGATRCQTPKKGRLPEASRTGRGASLVNKCSESNMGMSV